MSGPVRGGVGVPRRSQHSHGRSELLEDGSVFAPQIRAEREQLGKRLRALRHRAGLTQEALAERMRAVTPKQVQRVERGLANVTLAVLVAAAASLDVSVGALFARRKKRA